MIRESVASAPVTKADRVPPYSEEAERGVLGSILLDSMKIMDLCIERQLIVESFYVPAHRIIFEALLDMSRRGMVIDVLTVAERLKAAGKLDDSGGAMCLDRLIDSTPTAAHAEYYTEQLMWVGTQLQFHRLSQLDHPGVVSADVEKCFQRICRVVQGQQ